MDEIEIDFYAASSAWGQHANRNKTWVRLHHKPTWIIVSVWDSRSQLQNKEKAFNVLKAKLLQIEKEKQAKEQRIKRLYQVWTWDRSEKIRTYNFPQDRVTDHRIKKSYSNLPAIMDWEIDQIINNLIIEDQAMMLKLQ
jgi:peptide chain release factor 1